MKRLARLVAAGWHRARTARCGAVLALLAAVLQACAAPLADRQHVAIAPGVYFAVPSPAELGYSVNATQLITAKIKGETYLFQAQVMISPERLVMVGLGPFGQRALTITSTLSNLTVHAEPGVPADLRATNILADMAIIYWPAEAVRRGLAGSTGRLSASPQSRSITVNGREIIHVDYGTTDKTGWVRSARYVNIAYGYELDLRSAAVTP
jgi:Protein of unknown function (DUF3261)